MNKKIILFIEIVMILLVSAIVSSYTPSKNFYFENGEEINSTMMEWLLYNTDFDMVLKNHTFIEIIGEFELRRTERAYFINITDIDNKTHKPCIILRFLRKYPEILLRFPNLEQEGDNINWGIIDRVDCFSTQGGGSNTESSGRGGGGGGAAVASKVADSKAHMWQIIRSNQIFSLKINKGTISITKIEITNGGKELRNVDLEVQALTENPVSKEAGYKVYQYLRINRKNINAEDVDQIKIFFNVSKEWLDEYDIERVVLKRFGIVGWEGLKTIKDKDGYSTIINDFSSFAVVGIQKVIEEPPEEVPIEEVTSQKKVEKPKPIEAPSKAPVAWIIAAIVIILGIVLIVVYQKKES